MKKLLSGCVGLLILFSSVQSKAMLAWIPNGEDIEYFGGDPYTSLVGTVAGIIASFSEPEMGATVNVEQEEIGALESGSEKFEKLEMTGSATSQGFSTTAYDYVREKTFGSVQFMHSTVRTSTDTATTAVDGVAVGGNTVTRVIDGSTVLGTTATTTNETPYAYFGNQVLNISRDDAKKMIKENFFIENPEDMTPENVEAIRIRRTQYLQDIGTQYAVIAQEVQTRLIADLQSTITTPLNGDGLMGAVSGLYQAWLAACRALMADIGLQIELLELDAAKFLRDQPYNLLKEPEGDVLQTTGSGSAS